MSDELILEFEDEYIGSAVSPTVDITETTTDVTVTITDFQGDHAYTIEKTDQAIADAEQAATNANTAAANATSTANQAAQAATQAAGTANTAAQNADAKAALADSKAALANQAATTANQAAEAAEAAKTAANTAAGQATTAAGTANTAAGNADVKAQLADTAAANADTAAQAANNAADVAIEAAEDMPRLIGTVDTVQTVADAWPTTLEGAVVYGKCVQDGTQTPDNPVPVEVVGGNTFPLTGGALNDGGTIVVGGVTFTRDNNMITANGISTSTYPQAHLMSWSEWLTPGKTYTISKTVSNVPAGGKLYVIVYENDTPEPTSMTTLASLTNLNSRTFTVTKLYTHAIVVAEGNGVTWDGAKIGVTLMEGSTASPYVPYGCIGLQIGETVTPIDLQGYGIPDGDLLRVDSTGHVTIEQGETPTIIDLGTIELPELTNPCTLAIYASLDPEWAISYEQDPNIVVNALQSSIALVEGAVASTNYAVGAYLMHGNQLYRVTSAIATGEAITPGSNCVSCTVMGEVIRLTA